MKLFFNLGLSLAFILTQSYAQYTYADQSMNALKFQTALAAEIFNHSKDVGELLKNLQPYLTKEESEGVEKYFIKKNLSLNTPLASAKSISNKIVLSTGEEFKIIEGGRVSYQGKQFKKTKAMDLMLEEIEQRINAKQSLFNVLIPEANAIVPAILVVVALCFLVSILAGAVWKLLYSEASQIEKIMEHLKINSCEKMDPATEDKITFVIGRDETVVTAAEAEAKGFPPNVFQKLFDACKAQGNRLSRGQIVTILQGNNPKDVKTDAKTLRKGLSY